MFKNIIVYRMAPGWQAELTELEQALAKTPFQECGATQEKSSGWVPPRGEAHGLLAESVGGQWILRFMTEAKLLPATVLARKVKEKAAQIEQQTGRKPGKKETKELKEEAKHAPAAALGAACSSPPHPPAYTASLPVPWLTPAHSAATATP